MPKFKIVFYYDEPARAKVAARGMTAKPDAVRIYDVSVWDGRHEPCDEIIVMPDVPGWQRKRIEVAYGPLALIDDPSAAPAASPAAETDLDKKSSESGSEKQVGVTPKTAIHMGAGRWFVMRGDEQVSGPHGKNEAQRLAAES